VQNKTLTEIAYEIVKDSDDFLYCKYDSSVSNGFEIVSHPVTFNAFKNMDLQKYFLKHRTDVKGFHTSDCGMHVHLNRTAFNDMQLYKFVLMLNEYDKLTKVISQRRRESEFDSWSQFLKSQKDDVKRESAIKAKRQKDEIREGRSLQGYNKKYKATMRIGDRYQVVNLNNSKTIEVRCFKSNMDEVSFRKNVEFLDSMFYFCKETAVRDLNVENFIKFVNLNKKDYSNLIKFLNREDTIAKLLS